jgi:hypothetical protein
VVLSWCIRWNRRWYAPFKVQWTPNLTFLPVMPMVSDFSSTTIFPFTTLQLVPTINGYKRLVGGEAFWAPNAITYGYDSRAASIRIISPPSVPPSATRFELRVPGADMNPYFALSAIFLLGLRGIDKNMKLEEPPISMHEPQDRQSVKVVVLFSEFA